MPKFTVQFFTIIVKLFIRKQEKNFINNIRDQRSCILKIKYVSLITDHILRCFSVFFYKSVKYILKYTVYTVIKYVYIYMSLLEKKACNLTFTGYGKVNEQIQLHS